VLEGILDREAQARSEDAFVRVADGELHRAYRLAGLILGDQHEAEDATQDALLRAWTAFGSLRREGDFQAWFDRILVNVCRDRMRRRRVVRFIPMAYEHGERPSGDPFAQLIAGDELLRAMETLDADLRTVIVLRYWADLTVDEIARRSGWRSGTVKSRLHRALSQMKQRLQSPSRADEALR
jgi:RNA polymerase sigma-70 factor (ECF subfamily)